MGKMNSLALTETGQIGKIRHCEVGGYKIKQSCMDRLAADTFIGGKPFELGTKV